MEQEIRNLIKKHYKKAFVYGIEIEPEIINIKIDGVRMEYLAKRLLEKYSEINWVRFLGGWSGWYECVYSRETLRWAGYNI